MDQSDPFRGKYDQPPTPQEIEQIFGPSTEPADSAQEAEIKFQKDDSSRREPPRLRRRLHAQISPGELYLTQRGISLDTASRYGLEIDTRVSSDLAKERLGRGWPRGEVNAVIWIPIIDASATVIDWIARPLPNNSLLPRFVCRKGSGGPPLIFKDIYKLAHGIPIIIAESPIKAIACDQCGLRAIGINGVWGASVQNECGFYLIRSDLGNALDWRGRQAYLAFDADWLIKPEVRQALIRTFFVLSAQGAQVFLLSWDPLQGKGIDDYLANQTESNGSSAADALKALVAGAKLFIDLIDPSPLNLALVQTEFGRVLIPSLLRDQLIKGLARVLDVRVEALREACSVPPQAKPELSFAANYEPWPDPVDAEELLNQIMGRINKEVTIETRQVLVCGLWVMLTWVHPQMDFSPMLYITGPTLECGKTTLLNAIGKMVRRPAKTANVSAAAIYRLSELYHPTFLMDEAQDQLKNQDFWLVIKSGHAPGEYAIRCNPNSFEPEPFDVFCPKLLAGIGRANAQIMSRSIIIEMERKDGQRDRSLKESDPAFVEIRRKLARWANDVGDLRRFQFPQSRMRHGDNWEALYRVACGVSEAAAHQLVSSIAFFTDEEQDYATYLLNSLRKVYREHDQLTKDGFMGSEAIVNALNRDKEAPWYGGDNDKGLTVHALARHLKRYKVKPDQVWQSDAADDVRGYRYVDPRARHNDLKRVFDQYLGSEDPK